MKAILVIDLDDENISHYGVCVYHYTSRQFVHIDVPLKPMPQKKVVTVKRIEDIQSYSITEVADKISAKILLKTNEVFALGWNSCLEEIEK